MAARADYLAPVLTPAQIRALQHAAEAHAGAVLKLAADENVPGQERRQLHAEARSLKAAQEVLQRTLRASGEGDTDG